MRCGGGPPPCWEASEIPPAAGHHAPQKLSASRLAPDLSGLLGDLPATPPARLEPRPSSSQIRKRDISASARVGTLVRPSLSWKGVKLFPVFNGPRTGSSVPVCLGRLTRGAMRHMAIIRAHPRWSGRSRLAKCPRPPLLLHRATSSASPPPTALLRAPLVDPGADLVKPTRGAPLAMSIALPCIGHRFLDQGSVLASSRKWMSILSIVDGGRVVVGSSAQTSWGDMSSTVGRDTQWPLGSPRFDVAVRPVIQHKVGSQRRGRGRGSWRRVTEEHGVETGQTLGDLTQSRPWLSIPRQMAAISSPPALQLVRASIDAWTKGGRGLPRILDGPTVAPPFLPLLREPLGPHGCATPRPPIKERPTSNPTPFTAQSSQPGRL